jgi:ABC-type multidrug transport system fused ATPase/permease subunit
MKIISKNVTKQSLALLPRETPKKLSILLAFQMAISTLDVFAILLLGIVSRAGIDYSQSKFVEFPKFLVTFFNIDRFEFVIQVAIISTVVVALFILRTVVSILGNRRIFLYLANQASFASKQIVERMFSSKPQFMINRNSQEFLYGITQGIDNLTLSYLGSVTVLITESVFLMIMIAVIFVIQPLTGFMTLIIFALAAFGIHKITSGKTKAIASEFSELSVNYNRRLLDTLLVYRELFLRQKQVAVTHEIQVARSKSLTLRARLIFLPTLSKYLFELVLVLGGSLIALTQLTISNTITAISSVTVFLAAASRVLPSLIRAQGALLSVRQSEGSAEITLKQLSELALHETPQFADMQSKNTSAKFEPNLKIEDLTFRHDMGSSFLLEVSNLRVHAGQFVAIVGESGSGKTTLIDLILGMKTPHSGLIEISSLPPLEAINRWPGKIAYVPQNVAVVDGDIGMNVTLQESWELLDSEIFNALEKAHLKSDLLEMPMGLHEHVGERGIRLSGGQRQRLGIARALFTKPEMIIFDEATSSLDPITEKAVTDSIYGKVGEVTLIVVAHRLSTVKNADLVILMDKGKIVAKGTFDEVRAISPKFDQQAKLVNL